MIAKVHLGKLVKIAREIKGERIGKKYTQKMLATDIKKSQSYIGDIESGRTYPTLKVLGDIALACGVPISFFTDVVDNCVNEQLAEYSVDVRDMVSGIIRDKDDLNLNFLSGLEKDRIKPIGYPRTIPSLDIETVSSHDFVNIPIVGVIRAGEPILAEQNIEGYFPTDKQFINAENTYFYLRVKGDSMDKEFQEGSLLLIQQQNYIENGQIGIVLIDEEEATVKRIYHNEKMITLVPNSNNTSHQPIIINMEKEKVEIIGRVALAIKKY